MQFVFEFLIFAEFKKICVKAMIQKDMYETPRINVFGIIMSEGILTISGDNENLEPGDDIGSDED